MAYGFVQAAQVSANTGSNLTTPSIIVTLGNTLVVWCYAFDSTNATISGNGNTFSLAGIQSASFGGMWLMAYFCQNAAAGATVLSRSGGDLSGFYVAEYSGLATSGGLTGAFVTNGQAGPGAGANVLNSSAVNVTSQPSVVFACTVDNGGIQQPTSNTGTINAGNTLAWQGRNATRWIDSVSVAVSAFEDIEVVATGNITATFGCTGNKQFTTFMTGAFALGEAGGGPVAIPLTGQILM